MKKFNNFITLEGPEGSGKSTIAKSIKRYLTEKGYEVILTREPGGQDLRFAEEIREIILRNDNLETMTELLLFSASRKEHISKVVRPAIAEGKIVICDRFADSSIVYQGIAQGFGKEKVEKINEIVVANDWPSLTLLFDVSPEIGLSRIKDNQRETNRFDDHEIEFHEKVRNGYILLEKDNERIIKVDASVEIEMVEKQVFDILDKHIND